MQPSADLFGVLEVHKHCLKRPRLQWRKHMANPEGSSTHSAADLILAVIPHSFNHYSLQRTQGSIHACSSLPFTTTLRGRLEGEHVQFISQSSSELSGHLNVSLIDLSPTLTTTPLCSCNAGNRHMKCRHCGYILNFQAAGVGNSSQTWEYHTDVMLAAGYAGVQARLGFVA